MSRGRGKSYGLINISYSFTWCDFIFFAYLYRSKILIKKTISYEKEYSRYYDAYGGGSGGYDIHRDESPARGGVES